MKVIFERSSAGRGGAILPPLDVPPSPLPSCSGRKKPLRLPQLAEVDVARHYAALAKHTYGVNHGFYPLGSCTMKYNPSINEELAALPGFTNIHPLQPDDTVQGCLEVLALTEKYLCSITGMDRMTLQPAAGSHGEFTGLLLIKSYHQDRNDEKRKVILVPDSAHGTNPASAALAGFTVVNIPSDANGLVDIGALKSAVGEDTAGLMLTNPNTVGLFDKNILEITDIIHKAGGLVYYDGANLNAIMGKVRPGDMGFDTIHLNLHKSFATPHGGGGPGSGPVGCKDFLTPYLPAPTVAGNGPYHLEPQTSKSIGRVKEFHGNFLVIVKAFAYLCTLGKEGIPAVAEDAVLNANYLMKKLADIYEVAFPRFCMHEFVLTLEGLKKDKGVSALDIAKALIDLGIHPPTMYFPLIVHEALMIEPTETESKESLDEAAVTFLCAYEKANRAPEEMHELPMTAPVRRLDEVTAARTPHLRYDFPITAGE